MLPDISVIIPCYNNHHVLPWILKSINRSHGPTVQTICVDDASTVCLREIVEGAGAEYIRLNETPGRRAFVRHVGHLHARASLTLYMDGDVVPEPRLIDVALRMHRQHHKVAIKYSVYGIPRKEQDPNLIEIGELILTHNMTKLGPKLTSPISIDTRPLPRRLRGLRTRIWTLCASHCLSVEKKWVDEVGGWDFNFNGWGEEDLELAYRLHKAGLNFIYPHRKQAAAYHIDHPISWERNLLSLRRNAKYFSRKHPDAWKYRKSLLTSFLLENEQPDITADIGIEHSETESFVSKKATNASD